MARPYFWKCKDCDLRLEFNSKITQRKRRCPNCGVIVQTQDIKDNNGCGCLVFFLVFSFWLVQKMV